MNPRITIVGAGPAGSLAAILLARREFDVHLIEQHRFPRRKVCGECISELGIEVLKRAGLDADLLRAFPAQLRRAVYVAADGSSATSSLPREMWGLSRMRLDHLLLDAARSAGAIVHELARVEHIEADKHRVTFRDLTTNQTARLDHEYLIVAEGKNAFSTDRPAMTADLGVQAHFTGVRDDPHAISLFSLHGHYCGLAPIEDNLWNIAFSVPVEHVRRAGANLDQIWTRMLQQNAGLNQRLRHAHRVDDWLAAPLPRFSVRANWPNHVIPVGNAVAALEPIGGEGMGLALRSAELAADAIQHAASTNSPLNTTQLLRNYRRLWRWRSVTCRLGALLAARPAISRATVALLSSDPYLGDALLTLTGKRASCR